MYSCMALSSVPLPTLLPSGADEVLRHTEGIALVVDHVFITIPFLNVCSLLKMLFDLCK